MRSGFEEAGKLLLKARQPSAAVDQVLLAAGPGGMRLRIEVDVQGNDCLAPGRASLKLGAVSHHDLDGVIIGVNVGFHGNVPAPVLRRPAAMRFAALYRSRNGETSRG